MSEVLNTQSDPASKWKVAPGAAYLVGALNRVGFDFIGEIKDASRPITIFINQEDIDKGREGDPLHCTAAQCLQRALGGRKVAMFLGTAYVQLPGETHVTRYVVPNKLRAHVVIPQDTGGDPVPGTYTLETPVGWEQLGQTAIRQEKLRVLRSKGLAPPAKKQTGVNRHYLRTRWARIQISEEEQA